jgi:hypothetical protein
MYGYYLNKDTCHGIVYNLKHAGHVRQLLDKNLYLHSRIQNGLSKEDIFLLELPLADMS